MDETVNTELLLCRGIQKSNNQAIYGFAYEHQSPLQCLVPNDYEKEPSSWYILNTAFADWNMPRGIDIIEVVSDSICRYTGRKDKHDTRIYENDRIKIIKQNMDFAIKFSEHFGYWVLCNKNGKECFNLYVFKPEEIKIIKGA